MRTVTQAAADRINITIKKPKKHGKLDILEVELKKDIRECMQCRYFYGKSRQCIATECVRKHSRQNRKVTASVQAVHTGSRKATVSHA